MSLQLKITYGKKTAEEGTISVVQALDLLETLIDLSRHLDVKVTWISEQSGRIIISCSTHPGVPGLQTLDTPADWGGLA